MSAGKVVVAGASGLAGGGAARAFANAGWSVTGISRRPPRHPVAGVDYRSVDLLDPLACADLTRELRGTSHLVYAAISETSGGLVSGWKDADHSARNALMFEQLLRGIADAAPDFRHVVVVHGAKAYATNHLTHTEIPLRESLPRPENDNFYFRQEDTLWKLAAQRDFSWSILRPPMIAGGGEGSNLSGLLAMALYVCLCGADGGSAAFPGPVAARGVNQMIDVRLLARAVVWSATAPSARNRIFNVTNGDVFCWADLWPRLCAALGVISGGAKPGSVVEQVGALRGRWRELVAAHGLALPDDPFACLGESFALADYTLGKSDRSVVMSTVAITQAGFREVVDTAESIADWIGIWRRATLLPPISHIAA
jgi:nucleoside-diphosphate-sugar epimerase